VLTFFGFMHGEAIGFAETPAVAVAYLGVAGLLFGCSKLSPASEAAPVPHEAHALPEPAE
jgi:AGZA family xanthine/uracil permease-like MFS transporter